MTHDEIIKQLESLLSHCKSMIEKDGGFPIWEKDCEALEAAIAALRPSGGPPRLEHPRTDSEFGGDGEDGGAAWRNRLIYARRAVLASKITHPLLEQSHGAAKNIGTANRGGWQVTICQNERRH